MIVLAASVLLAYLFREAGHLVVEKYLESACISTVNLSKVAGRFTRDGMNAGLFIQEIQKTSIEIVPFTQIHALYNRDEGVAPTAGFYLEASINF